MRIWNYIYFFLLLLLSLVVIAIFQLPDKNLHVIACDVGQGDGILIVYKNIQILTDGGPDNKVLDCIGRHVPFWDRTIEMAISTHPDADHITGLVEVVKRYNVQYFLINPINPGTPIYTLLENSIGGKGIRVINPSSGQSLAVGLIHLDIESPTDEMFNQLNLDNENSKLSKYKNVKDVNLYSIVYRLRYKNFSGLFLGDINPMVSDRLSVTSNIGKVNYIKIPHHGSSNGLTQALLEKTSPNVAVISVGKKNLWGFPSPEIINLLSDKYIKILRTDEAGDVEVVTDGIKYWWKN